jgi:hypothetical protein
LSHFFLLLTSIDDREGNLPQIDHWIKESRRNLFKFNANRTWHVIRSFSHSLLPLHLNLGSHALIYNLLFQLNLQSDNLCCFIFVLANDRGESIAVTLFSGSMLQTLEAVKWNWKHISTEANANAISRNNNFLWCLFFTF